MSEDDTAKIEVGDSLDEWLSAVAGGTELTKEELARHCCRHGLLNYEDILG